MINFKKDLWFQFFLYLDYYWAQKDLKNFEMNQNYEWKLILINLAVYVFNFPIQTYPFFRNILSNVWIIKIYRQLISCWNYFNDPLKFKCSSSKKIDCWTIISHFEIHLLSNFQIYNSLLLVWIIWFYFPLLS
jgi:hypothetical protein